LKIYPRYLIGKGYVQPVRIRPDAKIAGSNVFQVDHKPLTYKIKRRIIYMEKSMTTLGEVADRVNHMSKNCYDSNIPVSDISFESLENVCLENVVYPMKTIAQKSMSNRLGIPYQYLAKCPADIQAVNLNHWIKEERNQELFFRFDGDSVRAIFTPKYIPVDNFEVIERLDSLNFKLETWVQCRLDDEFMSLSIPDYERKFDINGDSFRPGIAIGNSEIGLASLSISAFVLRLVCTNGLVSKTDLAASFRHVSSKILMKFPDILERVSSELSEQKAKLKFSMESPVSDPLKTIESFNRQFMLRKEEIAAVVCAWPAEMGDKMFNIVQTYTRAAQYDGLPAESSYRLQRIGGNILGMLN
jgi:hypothetical protein